MWQAGINANQWTKPEFVLHTVQAKYLDLLVFLFCNVLRRGFVNLRVRSGPEDVRDLFPNYGRTLKRKLTMYLKEWKRKMSSVESDLQSFSIKLGEGKSLQMKIFNLFDPDGEVYGWSHISTKVRWFASKELGKGPVTRWRELVLSKRYLKIKPVTSG